MPRVDSLYMSSDFDTLKNDDSATATINIPASVALAAGATVTYTATVTVGEPESILSVMLTNNVDYPGGNYWPISTINSSDRTGSLGSYSVLSRFAHTGGSNVLIVLSIKNPYGSAMTTSATAETWTFSIRSIKVPRFS